MNASWTIPFIILGGALQSCGTAMNGQLNKSMVNPWLASAVSFVLIVFFFIGAFLVMPTPLPTTKTGCDAVVGRSRGPGRRGPSVCRADSRQ